ncbi:hypothetical protein ACJY8V_000967 [Escherichia coli]|nr:hypothetical protein [Escherichia coli]EFE3811428.1 hypothetical protein [Escherichia coli]EJF6665620.1 hypothetical protein [Escherichia coli]EJK1952091.1 hypothetical protein [Escherichia coli]HCN8164542.1 hypothetical protein [Escherichia coli]
MFIAIDYQSHMDNYYLTGNAFEGHNSMKTAHYYASRSTKFLVIGVNGKLTDERYDVSGKAEARKLAKELSATAWNF